MDELDAGTLLFLEGATSVVFDNGTTRRELFRESSALARIVELKDRLRSARPGTAIDGFTTWRSSRLPGGGS